MDFLEGCECKRLHQDWLELPNRLNESAFTGLVKAEEREKPTPPEELLTESKRLARYGATQAKKLGIKAGDVIRLINEYRQEEHRQSRRS